MEHMAILGARHEKVIKTAILLLGNESLRKGETFKTQKL